MEPTNIHPSIKALLAQFNREHLPPELRQISDLYHGLAHSLVNRGDLDGPELTVALRKLLESKDCAVRAKLPADRDIEWPTT